MQSTILDLISERLKISRKNSEKNLSGFSSQIVSCLRLCESQDLKDVNNDSVIIKNTIESFLPEILKDCEIFFEMPETKAMDALLELCNFACIFSDERDFTYIQIVDAINKIKASYPIKDLKWKDKGTLPMIEYDL